MFVLVFEELQIQQQREQQQQRQREQQQHEQQQRQQHLSTTAKIQQVEDEYADWTARECVFSCYNAYLIDISHIILYFIVS